MYAFATEGLDAEKLEELDAILNANGDGPKPDTKAKAARERAAIAEAMKEMR